MIPPLISQKPPALVVVSLTEWGCGQFLAQPLKETAETLSLYAHQRVGDRNVSSAQQVIEAIGTLEAGWDGYGARPISPSVCSNAMGFLAISTDKLQSPEITPTSNGTLNFEWESSDAEAYLEIGRTRYSGHIQPKQGDTIYLSGTLAGRVSEDSGVQQALALISGFLHVTKSASSLAQGIHIPESIF